MMIFALVCFWLGTFRVVLCGICGAAKKKKFKKNFEQERL